MISTQKGQLKNVQDGISRPQGSREIQKTKAERVLRDTLYILEQTASVSKLLYAMINIVTCFC